MPRAVAAVAVAALAAALACAGVARAWEASEHARIFTGALDDSGQELKGECGAFMLMVQPPWNVNNDIFKLGFTVPYANFVAMWGDLIGDPSLQKHRVKCDGSHVKPVFENFWDALLSQKDSEQLYKDGSALIANELSHVLSHAGNEVYRNFPDPPTKGMLARIAILATLNVDHFEEGQCARNAIKNLLDMYNTELKKDKPDTNRLMGILAYILHYYSDSFAAGHRRTPRNTLLNKFESALNVQAGGLSKMAHDEDNFNGLRMTHEGQSFTCYGDKHFFAPRNDQCRRRLATTACRILRKANSGAQLSMSDFTFPTVLEQQATCPLFILEGGSVFSRKGTFSGILHPFAEGACDHNRGGCTYCKFHGCKPITPRHDLKYISDQSKTIEEKPLLNEEARAVLSALECLQPGPAIIFLEELEREHQRIQAARDEAEVAMTKPGIGESCRPWNGFPEDAVCTDINTCDHCKLGVNCATGACSGSRDIVCCFEGGGGGGGRGGGGLSQNSGGKSQSQSRSQSSEDNGSSSSEDNGSSSEDNGSSSSNGGNRNAQPCRGTCSKTCDGVVEVGSFCQNGGLCCIGLVSRVAEDNKAIVGDPQFKKVDFINLFKSFR